MKKSKLIEKKHDKGAMSKIRNCHKFLKKFIWIGSSTMEISKMTLALNKLKFYRLSRNNDILDNGRYSIELSG